MLVERVYEIRIGANTRKRSLKLSYPRKGWYSGSRVYLAVDDELEGVKGFWFSGIDSLQALQLALKHLMSEQQALHSIEGAEVFFRDEKWEWSDEV